MRFIRTFLGQFRKRRLSVMGKVVFEEGWPGTIDDLLVMRGGEVIFKRAARTVAPPKVRST